MNILITGGGTGGHINPALAIGGFIRKLHPDWNVAYAGDPARMEGKLVPAAGFELYPVKMNGLARGFSISGIRHNLKALRTASKALKEADKIISLFKPDLVIGVGGYVSWPVVRKAQKRGIPTMIHEQNTFPGIATKLLAKHADVVLLPNAKAGERLKKTKKTVVVGNPVRDEFIYSDRESARKRAGVSEGELLIVSVGGSLGAKVFNDTMAEFFTRCATLSNCRFVHGTGRGSYTRFCAFLNEHYVKFNSPNSRIRVSEYIDDMPVLLKAADLVISRAGASTLAELAVCGAPAILIPSPNVTENHQYHNAKLVEQSGGAVVIVESELNVELLYDTVKKIVSDENRMRAMRAGASKLAIYDVCERIFEQIKLLIGV